MSVPKKHHFLPEFYLHGFCRDGQLWVYDKQRNTSSKLRPETFGIKKSFYTILDNHGNPEHGEVEKRLSIVENAAALVIQKINAKGNLELRDKYVLSVFAALLKCRTPAFEKWLNDVGDAVAKRIMRDAVPNPEAIQRRLEMWGQNDPGDPDQAQRLYEGIKREEWRFKASANMRVDQMLRLTRQFGRELTLMPWTIARAPSDASFIRTDNPMVMHTVNGMPNPPADWPTDSNPYWLFGEGILATEAEILLPLSQHSCLIIGMEQYNGRYIKFKKADTRRVNNIIATHYDRFLIARDEALLRRVARTVPG